MGAQTANPMAEYLLKLQLIVSNTEFMNDEEARKYETLESRLAGDKYVRAVTHTDVFESYTYADMAVYDLLIGYGYQEDQVFLWIKNPIMIPQDIKNILMEGARQQVISNYVEQNKYYATLTGTPFVGNATIDPDPIIPIPDEFYNQYQNDTVLMRGMPIHEMPKKYQELFMNSKYYQETIDKYPEAAYIKYIGSNSIPIEVSRKARDGDILLINTSKLSTHHAIFGNVSVEPDIVHAYTNVYRATRDYVYQTLRGDFSSIYENYNDLIRYLTIYMSIGACLNEFQKKSNKLMYMNNVTANNLFTLYGLPSVIMEGAPMIEFLKKLRTILMDKGTNYVYRVKDLIGYGDTDIYTLVMVKQQVFENGQPVYIYKEGETPQPKYNIVFRRLGTADDNTSYFKFRESTVEYPYEDIMNADPRWWNTPEVEAILNDMNYTLSNSKYIQLSTHMSMTDIWWQSVIFLRGMLDRRSETSNMILNLNRDIDDSSTITLYDAILSLIVMMHWQLIDYKDRAIPGNMYIPNNGYDACLDLLFSGFDGDSPLSKWGNPFKLASFNFDVRSKDKAKWEALIDYEYLGADFIQKVEKILDRQDSNIGEVLMVDIRSIYDLIAEKVRTATTIHDYRQATEAYNTLFLVDPVRDWYDTDTRKTDEILCEKYTMSDAEYSQLKTFFNIPSVKIRKDGEYKTPEPDLLVDYNNHRYPVYLWDVLNNNALDVAIAPYKRIDEEDDPVAEYVFRDPTFVDEFNKALAHYYTDALSPAEREATYADENIEKMEDSGLSDTIKNNYIEIIKDKINIDIGNSSEYGPTTFEYLLMMENTSLYQYINDQRLNNSQEVITMMRTIIQALETYTNSSLSALTCSALGSEKYMSILKEVISYFKSYMVEFTRDEFKYIFGGILDNGGNGDMLKLIDEIPYGTIEIAPNDSMALFDVSHADVHFGMADENIGMIYDEALFRLAGTYGNIKQTGYQLWYDDGKRITMTPSFTISDDEEVVGNFIKRDNEYIVIINTNNIESHYPPGYYGNVL